MNPPQQKSTMSSSTMKTLKICQNLGLSVSIIEGDSSLASPMNIQMQKGGKKLQNIGQESKAIGNQPRSLSCIPTQPENVSTESPRQAVHPPMVSENRPSGVQSMMASNTSGLPDMGQTNRQSKAPQNVPMAMADKTTSPQNMGLNVSSPSKNNAPSQQARLGASSFSSPESMSSESDFEDELSDHQMMNQNTCGPPETMSTVPQRVAGVNVNRLLKQDLSITVKQPDAFNIPNKAQCNILKQMPANQAENKCSNILINKLNKSCPFPSESKTPTSHYRLIQNSAPRLGDGKASNIAKQSMLSTPGAKQLESKMITNQSRLNPNLEESGSTNQLRVVDNKTVCTEQPRVGSNMSMNTENKNSGMHTRLAETTPVVPEQKPHSNAAVRNFQSFELPRTSSSSKPENIASPVAVVAPVQQKRVAVAKRLTTTASVSASLLVKKKCIEKVSPMQSEQTIKPFESINQQSIHPQKDERQTTEQQHFTTPAPSASPAPAKKKCIEKISPVLPEQTGKTFESNNLQSAQPQKEERLATQKQIFTFPSLSPGITITPVTALNAPKVPLPLTASITCKVLNESTATVKVVVCPHCKIPSRNLTKCDGCKQNITSGVPVYQTIKQKISQPVLMKNFAVSKEIIYPSMMQIQGAAGGERLQFKQAVQSKMVIVTSPQVRPQTRAKPKPRARRRYVEPVCLTISSDEEESMSGNFGGAQEESSSLPYNQESDSSKSANSSPSELASQEMQDMDDQGFPGVTDVHGNPVIPEMDFEEEEEAEDYGMEDEMDEAEDEEDVEEEEELEEEEEEEEEEVPPDEDDLAAHLEIANNANGFPICCRSIRIGSFKVHPRNGEQYLPVYVSKESFSFQVPPIDDLAKIVTIVIKLTDLVQLQAHFGKCLPIMFFINTPNFAENIRNLLHMSKAANTPYYDPNTNDDKQKRITFLIDNCTDEQRNFLRSVFPGEGKITEIDQKTANEILVRSTPHQNQLIKCQPVVMYQTTSADNQLQVAVPTTIQQNQLIKCQPVVMYQTAPADNQTPVGAPAAVQQQTVVKPQTPVPVTKILTYPPPPQTGGIPITSEDMACLNEGEFLNDAIIDFYLKYVLYEKLPEYSRERTHIFSSYFYPRLTQKPTRLKPGDEQLKSMQARRHGLVKTWTRHVDIFSKDYIIIPINQNVHWFLAIICFPGRVPEATHVHPKPEQKTVNKTVDNVTSTNDHEVATNKTNSTVKEQNCGEEGSNQNQEENSNSTTTATTTFELEEPPDPEDPNPEAPDSSTHPDSNRRRKEMPCICIFDSLSGPSRWRIASTLREYLDMEWKIKQGTRKVFDRNTMQGFVLRCPQQTNFSDCGLYVLQYVESFFETPLPYFGRPMPDLSDWFTDACVSSKREQIKKLIMHLQKRLSLTSSLKNRTLVPA